MTGRGAILLKRKGKERSEKASPRQVERPEEREETMKKLVEVHSR